MPSNLFFNMNPLAMLISSISPTILANFTFVNAS